MKTKKLLDLEYCEITRTFRIEYKPENQDFQHIIIHELDFVEIWMELGLALYTVEYIEANFWKAHVRTLIQKVLTEYLKRQREVIIKEEFFNLN